MANNYSFGGWYNNPAQGGKNMRYWGNDYWTTGEDPTGGRGVNWQQSQPSQSNQQQSQPSQQPPVQDFNSYVNQAQEMYKKAAEPAIQSIQSSIPEIKSSISSKTQLLTEKYNNLINSIKGNQVQAENRQTVVTAGEMGKRGIDPTSTLYGQELTNAINPITQGYTGLQADAINAQATGLSDLATLETEQLRNVSNTIAQLQSGAGENAINTAMSLYQQAQANAQNAQNMAEQKRQTDIANALAQKIYETIQLPESQLGVSNTQSLIDLRNRSGSNNNNDPLGIF